jgi:hypothetical protein
MTETTEIKSVTPRSVGIRYGVICAVVSIVYFVILNVAGLDQAKLAQAGNWLIGLVIAIMAQKYYKDNGDNFMSYGQGVGIAFWIGLICAGIASVFSTIYINFVDPEFVNRIRDKALADMEAKGTPEAQIEMAMKMVDYMTSPMALFIFGVVFTLIMMLVIGLILSIFTQKPRPEPAI